MLGALIPIRDHNPYKRFPLLTVGIIAVNVWVFLVVGVSDTTVLRYGTIACDVLNRCPGASAQLERAFPERSTVLSLFTSMFMHGGFAHLAGNMLYLWVFGNNVEDRLGHVRFAVFYVITGLIATFSQFAVSSTSAIPLVGASGAISGVLGAFVLWPHARVVALVPFLLFMAVEVSAGWLLGFWFVIQVLNALGGAGGGVAFLAHAGGFVAGWLLIRVFAPPRRRRDPFEDWFRG